MAEGILILTFAVATFFATAFPLIYLVLPWNSTSQGRGIMYFAASKALFMNVLLMITFWDFLPMTEWLILFTSLILVATAAAYRTAVLVRDVRSHWAQPPPPYPHVPTDLSEHP